MKEGVDIGSMLRRSEKTIEIQAQNFLGQGCSYDQLLQEGRRLVWKTISVNFIVEETFEAFKNLIRNELIIGLNSFIKYMRKNKLRYKWLFEVLPETYRVTITREKLDEIRKIALRTRDEKAVKATIYCLVSLMKVKEEDVPKVVNYDTFVKFGLQRFLWIFFSNSPYRALMMAYPDLRPEDMKRRPNGYWDQSDSKEKAIKDFANLLLLSKYSKRSFPLIVNEKFLIDHKFRTPLNKFFNGSPFAFLDAAFPGKYKPWKMSVTPMRCFEDKIQITKATKWLVETVLKFNIPKMNEFDVWREEVGRKISKEDFEKNGLRGLLNRFNNSPGKILLFVYPDKFKEWSFSNNDKWSRGAESLELAARATRWVIEEYAKLDPQSSNIGYRFFISNGLHGMITSKKLGFNSSPKAALENAYPERKNIQKPL